MNTKPLYITLAAVLVFGAWLFRYEIVAAGGGGESLGHAYRLDRWTGDVMFANPYGTLKLEPMELKPQQTNRAEEDGPDDLFKRFGIEPPSPK